MKRIRFLFAMLVAQLARIALKILGKPASYTPGFIALKLCPDFLGGLTMPEKLICVTGTNGKTTTSNLIADILRDCGYTVTNNSYGSNVQAGVATALLTDSTLTGKPKKQIAVLEVDERSSIRIYSYLTPDYLVCNNIMRDSLKRNAHTDFIVYIINKALSPKTHVILNADDLVCCSVAEQNDLRTYFGMTANKPEGIAAPSSRDIVYCPVCGSRLEPEYIRYNHIGRFKCTSCTYSSPTPDYEVSDIDYTNNVFTITYNGLSEEFKIINDNIVNIYNCCGAIALLSEFGLSFEQIKASMEKQKIVQTRFDTVKSGDLSITFQLAKGQNPIACARAYSYIVSCPPKDKLLYIMVDDKSDNTGNSESVCWIYDCDYSALCDDSVGQIIFAGPRCKDQMLRAVLAGVDESKIKLADSPMGGLALVDGNKYKDIFVLYDPYLLAEKDKIRAELIRMGGEEK